MSSITRNKTESGIRYYIQLSPGEDPKRPKIALGRVSRKSANTAKTHIEKVIENKKTGAVIPPATQEWLSGIPHSLWDRLEKLELVKSRIDGDRYTVKEWTDSYIKMRENDKTTKADTIRKLENVARRLSVFFKTEKLGEISIYDAKMFKSYLLGTVELSENTARKHIAISRQFFSAAIDKRLLTENPFKGQPVTIKPNPNRFFFITPEMAQKVLDACPDTQWRLIFGLARYGGLRCPSETLRLKWDDIDFANDRFTVHASKTEHHANGGIRTVPMFPELRPLFQDAFDEAKAGDVYCITRYRNKATNIRTQMNKIIVRAGLEIWPKTFQNLRSSRETELFKLTGGNVKAVCEWIGNTPEVAMMHYAQITEADMKEAAKMTILNAAEKTVHDPVHTTAESPRTDSHERSGNIGITSCDYKNLRHRNIDMQHHAKTAVLGRAGFEPA